jgi:class 3 adenylate cyclase
MSKKTVVNLDLVGYSDILRHLEENIDVKTGAQFNEQIQQFVDAGLGTVRVQRDQVVIGTAGDSALLVFDDPAVAHHFAEGMHAAATKHNAERTVPSAQRWFRIGAATGDLYLQQQPDGGPKSAGTVIANAVRLEAKAQPGQLVADAATFAALPPQLQALYGREETVPGKRGEKFQARRCTFVPYPAANEAPTVPAVLDLFDRLNPRDQLVRLMLMIGLPTEHRPPDTLTLAKRQDAIVDWAGGMGQPGLAKLDAALKHLIQKQSPLS